MTEQQLEEPKRGVGRPPKNSGGVFTVEFGTKKNNGWIVIRSLGRAEARGSWKVSNTLTNPDARNLAGMPDIPGSYLTVDIDNSKAVMFDPTHPDHCKKWDVSKDFWKKFNDYKLAASRRGGIVVPVTVNPRDDEVFARTPDELKTLLLELIRMAEVRPMGGMEHKDERTESAMLTVVRGTLPTIKEIEELTGRELFDPGAAYYRPRYADQFEDWMQKKGSPV